MTTVVGFDGSAASQAAVDYALEREGKGGQVIVVHAPGALPDRLGEPGYEQVLDEHAARGRVLLDALRLGIEGRADCELEFELVGGFTADAIARVAKDRHADQIVVGSRGLGALRATLGSVSHELLHIADRPVVVIPKRLVERSEHTTAA